MGRPTLRFLGDRIMDEVSGVIVVTDAVVVRVIKVMLDALAFIV